MELDETAFTAKQIEWLKMMRDQIAHSVEIRLEDLQKQPFNIFQVAKSSNNDFGKVEKIVNEFNRTLTT